MNDTRSGRNVTTSSVLDPKLTITDPWLKIFLAFIPRLVIAEPLIHEKTLAHLTRSTMRIPHS